MLHVRYTFFQYHSFNKIFRDEYMSFTVSDVKIVFILETVLLRSILRRDVKPNDITV